MPFATLASSHYVRDGIGDPQKILINAYSEENETDPQRRAKLVRRPGSRNLDTGAVIQSNLRGIGQADGHASGHIILIDDATVRTYDPDAGTYGTLTGTLTGSDRAQITFQALEGAILSGGDLFVSTGTSVAAVSDADWATLLSDHSQTDFTSITSISQRLIATYGDRAAFSDTLDFNNTTTLSYVTAESAPDGIVGAAVAGGLLYLFGSKTVEPWIPTGDSTLPFRVQRPVIQRGCLARDTIKLLDNTLFFVADDYTVRRIDGVVTRVVSVPWVVRALEAENPSDLIASVMEVENHSFYIINGVKCCLVYDIPTQEWIGFQTYGSDTWAPTRIIQVGSQLYAAGRNDKTFVQLSRSYVSDNQADAGTFGTEIVVDFTAHVSVPGGRPAIPSIRLDGVRGRGAASDVTQEAMVEMALSKDGGNTFGPWRSRSLGRQGQYGRRPPIWRQNGRANEEQLIMRFRSNDFAAVTAVALGED
ncbi:MAG: hypothetical protein AAGF20_00080 [Pseudomonadota bacterium]